MSLLLRENKLNDWLDIQTDLVSQNSYGTGSGDLFLPEPHRGEVRGNTKHKHRGYWAHKLAKEGDWEQMGTGTTNFDPRTDAVEGWTDEDDIPDAPVLQKPQDGHNERDIREEIYHSQPVDGQRVYVVEAHEDVADDAVLEPHEGVAGRDGAEEKQHEPAAAVQFGPGLRDQLHVVTP